MFIFRRNKYIYFLKLLKKKKECIIGQIEKKNTETKSHNFIKILGKKNGEIFNFINSKNDENFCKKDEKKNIFEGFEKKKNPFYEEKKEKKVLKKRRIMTAISRKKI